MVFKSLMRFCALVVFVGLFHQQHAELPEYKSLDYYDNIIEAVNSGQNLWQAGRNFDQETLSTVFDTLAGSLIEDPDVNTNHEDYGDSDEEDDDDDDDDESSEEVGDVGKNGLETSVGEPKRRYRCPHFRKSVESNLIGDKRDSFDGRVEWKHCPTVNQIWDQGACSSDWAIAATSAIADRLCIATNGTFNQTISPMKAISCCKSCGWGCRKSGYPSQVWRYWAEKGLVTGGPYESKQGCQPYSIDPQRRMAYTPRCIKRCYNKQYQKTYRSDIVKGKRYVRHLTCPYCTAGEIRKRGPVTATFAVFDDFLTYRSGIYHHVKGNRIGSLTVRLVGWDLDQNNVSYWIAANSWGSKFGENGFFKIKRTVDECMIESSVRAGYVKLAKHYE